MPIKTGGTYYCEGMKRNWQPYVMWMSRLLLSVYFCVDPKLSQSEFARLIGVNLKSFKIGNRTGAVQPDRRPPC
jgi:hypothetical protein